MGNHWREEEVFVPPMFSIYSMLHYMNIKTFSPYSCTLVTHSCIPTYKQVYITVYMHKYILMYMLIDTVLYKKIPYNGFLSHTEIVSKFSC